LEIPEPLRIYHLVPVGYAKSQITAPPRRGLVEITHYEKYDLNKFRDDQGMTKFIITCTLQGAYGRRDSAMRPRARLVPPLLLSTVAIGIQGKESGGDL
jgi:hypothetical protein